MALLKGVALKAKPAIIPTITALAGAAAGVGGMFLWGPSATTQATPDLTAVQDASQQTTTVALQTLESTVSATGTLTAVTSGDVAFEASGEVTAVYVQAGDTVEVGEVLAEIDTLQLTASLRAAEAELASAQATLANAQDEADGSDESDTKIASAQANVDVKAAAVTTAQEAMADAQLLAPIAGLVTAQNYEVGDVVSVSSGTGAGVGSAGTSSSTTSSTGITIVGQDAWTVSVSLDQDEVANVAVGNQVTFTADGVETFYGVVSEVSALPSTSSGSVTYPVTLQVTGEATGLYEGISVTADIVYLRRVDVLAVPTNAITTSDGVSTVTVVDDAGTEESREVTLGDSIGTYTEIVSGLTEGESIVFTTVTGSGTSSSDTGFGAGFPSDFDPSQFENFDPSQLGGAFPPGQAADQ